MRRIASVRTAEDMRALEAEALRVETDLEEKLIEARNEMLQLRSLVEGMRNAHTGLLDDVIASREAAKNLLALPAPRRPEHAGKQLLASISSPRRPRRGSVISGDSLPGVERKKAMNSEVTTFASDPFESVQKIWSASWVNSDGQEGQGRSLWTVIARMVTSKSSQGVVLFLIHVNLIVLWLEVDIEEDSDFEPIVSVLSYLLSVSFFVEAVLNMAFVPGWWRYGDLRIDVSLCIIVFVTDTLVVIGIIGRSMKYFTVLRCLRIVRFAWKIRAVNAGRPIRILTSSAEGCFWNFFWVAFMLMLSFYPPAVIMRMVLEEEDNDEVHAIVDRFFSSTPESWVTFMAIFLGSVNYGQEILRPLFDTSHWFVGACLLIYGVVMVTCVASFITGMFVEYILKVAKLSDVMVGEEMLASRDLNFDDLLRVFQSIDTDDLGFFTFRQWVDALDRHPDFERVLGVRKPRTVEMEDGHVDAQGYYSGIKTADDAILARKQRRILHRDREIFFQSLDILGDGEIAFSDFVYGVMKNVCPPRTLEQLIFDHQFSKFVKLSGQTCRSTFDIQAFLQQQSINTRGVSTKMRDMEATQGGDVQNVTTSITAVQEHIRTLETGLVDVAADGVGEGHDHHDQGQGRRVLTVEQARQAVEMNGLMQGLIAKLSEAGTCADKQAAQMYQSISHIRQDFSNDVDTIVDEQLQDLVAEGTNACRAAEAAADSTRDCRDLLVSMRGPGLLPTDPEVMDV